jgi:hypothetical protein
LKSKTTQSESEADKHSNLTETTIDTLGELEKPASFCARTHFKKKNNVLSNGSRYGLVGGTG